MAVRRFYSVAGNYGVGLSRGYLSGGADKVPGTGVAGCIERYLSGRNGGSRLATAFYPLDKRKMGDTEIVPRYLHNSRSRGSVRMKGCKSPWVSWGNSRRSSAAGELSRRKSWQ